jgi:transposase InsO family protein
MIVNRSVKNYIGKSVKIHLDINNLAGVLDLCGRELVGWAMGERMTKELVITALRQAKGRRGNPKGVLSHSDRGSQYCSFDYQRELKKDGFICSISRKGNCWDNAPMESFCRCQVTFYNFETVR